MYCIHCLLKLLNSEYISHIQITHTLRSISLGFAPFLLERKLFKKLRLERPSALHTYSRITESIVHQPAEQGICHLYRVRVLLYFKFSLAVDVRQKRWWTWNILT